MFYWFLAICLPVVSDILYILFTSSLLSACELVLLSWTDSFLDKTKLRDGDPTFVKLRNPATGLNKSIVSVFPIITIWLDQKVFQLYGATFSSHLIHMI